MTKKPETIKEEDLIEKYGVMYKEYSRKPFTGYAVDYHENGQLQFKCNWKDGKRNGLLESYHDNGQLKTKGNYKDGKLIE